MNGSDFLFLMGGVFVGVLILAVYDGLRLWAMHEENVILKQENLYLTEMLTDAQEGQRPREWQEPSGVSVLTEPKRPFTRPELREIDPDLTILDLTNAEEDSTLTSKENALTWTAATRSTPTTRTITITTSRTRTTSTTSNMSTTTCSKTAGCCTRSLTTLTVKKPTQQSHSANSSKSGRRRNRHD